MMGVLQSSTFTRHRGPITCAAAVPYSKYVLTSGYDGAVGMFDIAAGEGRLLGYHRHLVNRVAVDAQGRRAASASSDYTISLWDLKACRLIRVLRGHSDDVEDFTFIDDARGASVSRDWRVLVWDLTTGSIVRELEGHQKDVLSVCHHNGRLVTAGDDMTLRVWDLESGRLLKMWGPFETETDTCAIDFHRERAILGCDDGHVRVFDLNTGDMCTDFAAHDSGIKKVAVSTRTGDILSAAYDQRIIIWDADTFSPKTTLQGRAGVWERSLNWSADGASILAGTFDGTVLIWDATTGHCLNELGTSEKAKGNACFNEVSVLDQDRVVLVSDDGYVRLARLSSDEASWVSQVEPASGRQLMNAVTASARYGLVVSGTHDQKIHIFKAGTDRLSDEVEVYVGEGPINSIRLASQPGYEAMSFVACYSGAIVCVGPDGKIHRKSHLHGNAVKALRLHPKKPVGVSCSADGMLISWDFSGRLLRRYLGHTAIIDDVDLDPAGTRLASTGRDFSLKVYSLDGGDLLYSFSLGRRSPKAVCFFDESTIIVANYWGELIKVTLPTQTIFRRTIARNGISSVVRYGSHVLATSYDGGVYLVRADDLSVINCLRAMTQRLDGITNDW